MNKGTLVIDGARANSSVKMSSHSAADGSLGHLP